MTGMIKAMLVGLLGLFVFSTLFSLLIPSKIRVSRSVVINDTSRDSVWNRLTPLSRWTTWHPYFKNDSVRVDFSESPVDSLIAGLTVSDVRRVMSQRAKTDTSIQFQLLVPGDKPISIWLGIHQVPNSNMVQVDWNAVHQLRWYPWEKFYGIFIDQLTGPAYEEALQHLKASVEHMPVAPRLQPNPY